MHQCSRLQEVAPLKEGSYRNFGSTCRYHHRRRHYVEKASAEEEKEIVWPHTNVDKCASVRKLFGSDRSDAIERAISAGTRNLNQKAEVQFESANE